MDSRMNCPICQSLLKEQTNKNGSKFLMCSGWPECRILGTPELITMLQYLSQELRHSLMDPWAKLDVLERLEKLDPLRATKEQPETVPLGPGPVPLGAFITKLAQMRIHQSKLRGKTAEEREAIRKQALEAIR